MCLSFNQKQKKVTPFHRLQNGSQTLTLQHTKKTRKDNKTIDQTQTFIAQGPSEQSTIQKVQSMNNGP